MEKVKLDLGNASMPAMPVFDSYGVASDKGLTKREHFAGLAMQGILARGNSHCVASEAVACADALLAELAK